MNAHQHPQLTPAYGPTGTGTWPGTWVSDRLGISIETTKAPLAVYLDELVGLAVRRNSRRAHLLVSSVLGKHVPTDPHLVLGAGMLLGRLAAPVLNRDPVTKPTDGNLLRAALRGDKAAARRLVTSVATEFIAVPNGTVVLGYAETATALGHAVADVLHAPYLHSTRRASPGAQELDGFEEEHSHATSHLLLPEDAGDFNTNGPLVLVDDELSTGTTALNTIAALHGANPRTQYVIATLVDLRSDEDRARMASVAADLGARIDMVALAGGRVALPDDILDRGAALICETEAAQAAAAHTGPPGRTGSVSHIDVWPAGLREGGRHGFSETDRRRLNAALPGMGRDLAAVVNASAGNAGPHRVHVLGFEELMYAPLRLATALADTFGAQGRQVVTYSTTTRSPVLAVPDDGYAIRSQMTFAAHDNPGDGPGPRFAYNVAPATAQDSGFDTVVLVIDDHGHTDALFGDDGLVTQLATSAGQVVIVTIPSHRLAGDHVATRTATGKAL